MKTTRDIRKCALQAMYQFDLRQDRKVEEESEGIEGEDSDPRNSEDGNSEVGDTDPRNSEVGDSGGGDYGGENAIIRETLNDSPGNEKTHSLGFELAQSAWAVHTQADAAITPLTPEWPIHRQPVIDRNILRLAYYEMHDAAPGSTPPKVAINEAVELAKEFGSEKSPMFINGVLDKLYRELKQQEIDTPTT